MRIFIEMVVSLKIPDVTALTARRTLQRRMGFGEQLLDLTRADWWRLELDAPDLDAALALGRELAEQTNCFVNPNKHVYQVCERFVPPPAPTGSVIGVLCGFHDDPAGELTLAALRGRLGYADRVYGVERGTLWLLHLAETDPARARELAEAITVTVDHRGGLLVNRHSMWWRWADEEVGARG